MILITMFRLRTHIELDLIQNKTISCITFFKLSSNNTFFLIIKDFNITNIKYIFKETG